LIPKQQVLTLPLIKHLEEIKHPEFDRDDLKTLEARLTGISYIEYSKEELAKTISLLIGRIGLLTGVNIPSDANTFNFLRVELSDFILSDPVLQKITFEENINAFRMFVKGLIGGEKKDYGKMLNIEYYSVITFAYLRYRSDVFFKVEQYHTKNILQPTQSDSFKELDYYSTTEAAYQQYLRGNYNPMVWNPNCYDCCVKLGWIEKDAFTDYLSKSKAKLMKIKSEEIQEFEKTSIKLDGNIYSTKDNLPINIGKLMTAVFDLTKIKDGEPGWLIVNVAKQLVLEEMFKQFALRGYENIFIEEKN